MWVSWVVKGVIPVPTQQWQCINPPPPPRYYNLNFDFKMVFFVTLPGISHQTETSLLHMLYIYAKTKGNKTKEHLQAGKSKQLRADL